jgi:hypothetical protein
MFIVSLIEFSKRVQNEISAKVMPKLQNFTHGVSGHFFRIGSSNPAMSFSLARAPIVRQSIARWHNKCRFPRRKLSQKSLTTDDKRAAMQRLPDVTNS